MLICSLLLDYMNLFLLLVIYTVLGGSFGIMLCTSGTCLVFIMLTSTNHKQIAIIYLYLSVAISFIGSFRSIIIRLELRKPGNYITNGHLYNVILTAHALIIILLTILYI